VNIFKRALAAGSILSGSSLEVCVRRGYALLERSARRSIALFIQQSSSSEGGFVNRAGSGDVYYTLWGSILSRALKVKIDRNALRSYARGLSLAACSSRADALSAVILLYDSAGDARRALQLFDELKNYSAAYTPVNESYSLFLEALTLLRLKKFPDCLRLVEPCASDDAAVPSLPTPLLAARLVLLHIRSSLPPLLFGDKKINSHKIDLHNYLPSSASAQAAEKKLLCDEIIGRMKSSGGISASRSIASADLLSSAVGVYALNFCKFDLRLYRVDLLNYVISLYSEGSFLAVPGDHAGDIEYLFYGLLALGALS